MVESTKLTKLSNLAKKLVMEGGTFALKHFLDKNITTKQKSDRSLVSRIDTDIESRWIKNISRQFPNHQIHGEETGKTSIDSDYTWYLDPIDGTSNFLHHRPLFGSMIAVTYQGSTILSTIYLPSTDQLYWANIENPAHINENKLEPVKSSRLSQITLITDSGKTHEGRELLLKYLLNNYKKYRSIRINGCVSSHILPLSSNEPTISIIIDASPFDLAPVELIFRQAGYTTINLQAKPWSLSDNILISLPTTLKESFIPTLQEI